MNTSSRLFKLIASVSILSGLVGCGGAPGDNDNFGNNNSGGSLVTASRVPTEISLSGEFNKERTLDFDGTPVNINVILSNFLGNPSFDGSTVEFVSPEMGVVDNNCQIVGTRCNVEWISAGARPENRLVSVLAMVSGAEDFIDENNNELYDDGELFVDLTEPFADTNEDGVHTPANPAAGIEAEFFKDLNGNGTYDVENGVWDGPCSMRSGSCTGSSEAILFDNFTIILCPVLDQDNPLPGCEPLE